MTAGRNNSKSVSHHWGTPPKYVNAIRQFFDGTIALDPCSSEHSIVGATVEFKLPETDGLAVPWNYETVFVNPPYGADRERGTTIRDWLRKCAGSHAEYGAEVLALVPVATNTNHWKLYVWGAATAVAFLYDTRLRFLIDQDDRNKGAPMSCAMVYWGSYFERFHEVFVPFGAVVDVRHCRNVWPSMGVQMSLTDETHQSHSVGVDGVNVKTLNGVQKAERYEP